VRVFCGILDLGCILVAAPPDPELRNLTAKLRPGGPQVEVARPATAASVQRPIDDLVDGAVLDGQREEARAQPVRTPHPAHRAGLEAQPEAL
jgi:hypothetical protein